MLPSYIDVCPVHLPGRERRFDEPAFTHITPLVEALEPALSPYFDIPFAFFGHSMGAIVGFELTRQLRRHGAPQPRHLFVSAHRGPRLPDPDPAVHNLPFDELAAELRRLQGTPPEVLEQPELMELLLPLLRADFELSETYTYSDEPPLSCSITAFGGEEDPKTSREELEAWREQTSGHFMMKIYPGNHFFLAEHQRSVLQIVAQQLAQELRQDARLPG